MHATSQKMQAGVPNPRHTPTAVRNSSGHSANSPSGVAAQSNRRTRSRISPGPASHAGEIIDTPFDLYSVTKVLPVFNNTSHITTMRQTLVAHLAPSSPTLIHRFTPTTRYGVATSKSG